MQASLEIQMQTNSCLSSQTLQCVTAPFPNRETWAEVDGLCLLLSWSSEGQDPDNMRLAYHACSLEANKLPSCQKGDLKG